MAKRKKHNPYEQPDETKGVSRNNDYFREEVKWRRRRREPVVAVFQEYFQGDAKDTFRLLLMFDINPDLTQPKIQEVLSKNWKDVKSLIYYLTEGGERQRTPLQDIEIIFSPKEGGEPTRLRWRTTLQQVMNLAGPLQESRKSKSEPVKKQGKGLGKMEMSYLKDGKLHTHIFPKEEGGQSQTLNLADEEGRVVEVHLPKQTLNLAYEEGGLVEVHLPTENIRGKILSAIEVEELEQKRVDRQKDKNEKEDVAQEQKARRGRKSKEAYSPPREIWDQINGEFPKRDRQVFESVVYAKFTYREVAKRHKISLSSAYQIVKSYKELVRKYELRKFLSSEEARKPSKHGREEEREAIAVRRTHSGGHPD
jgi:hypothetical protein